MLLKEVVKDLKLVNVCYVSLEDVLVYVVKVDDVKV